MIQSRPMKKILYAAVAILILAGCTPATKQASVSESEMRETQTLKQQPDTDANPADETTLPTADALKSLDEALANATTKNKRVLVHLGATW